MKRRLIPILAHEALLKMPTKQLMGRLRALHQCEQSAALSDLTADEIAYGDLKAVLAAREHVPSGAQRAKIRLERGRVRPGRKSNQQGGANGRQPSRSVRIRASSAAASRRSPEC